MTDRGSDTNKALIKYLAILISAMISAVVLLYLLFPPSSEIRLDEYALGNQTQTVIGSYKGDRVHCFGMSHANECLNPATGRSLDKKVLWLGNSQLHAINQPNPESLPASVHAAQLLRPHSVDLITFSQPNANLVEHYILFEALNAMSNFDVIVLPVVFDDMREQSVRASIRDSILDLHVAERLQTTEFGRSLVSESITKEKTKSVSLQNRSELWITSKLEACCHWETIRANARGKIWLFVYQLRNAVFGINPSSIRRKIPANYKRNFTALNAILHTANTYGMEVIVYIPPLRSDVIIPYDPVEYAAFKLEVEALSQALMANFVDFEDLVPGPLWGMKDSTSLNGQQEIDFMHFQDIGHELLGHSIANVITEILDDI